VSSGTAASSANALPRPARSTVRLSALAQRSGGTLLGVDTGVSGVSIASGQVRPGDLFAAIAGGHVHGATHAAAAVANGAVAVLTDPAGRALVPPGVPTLIVTDPRSVVGPLAGVVYGDPSARLAVVGITGTSGKTTTSYLVRAGLSAANAVSGLIGTVATVIGDEVIPAGFTTPEAPDLQALLAVMAERGASSVVMEVSSHALELGRVNGIGFAIAAFTNLSQDHLDFHPDMPAYFAAKARLFDGRAQRAIVVVDDEWGVRMAAEAGPDAITVATTEDDRPVPARWNAVDVQTAADGSTRFRALGPGVDVAAGCGIPGRYNVANALLALAVLDSMGVAAEVAAPAVAAATVPGRMERIDRGQPYLAVVDYSHKPAAVTSALAALRPLTAGRLILVLGSGGDRDRGKRPMMGQAAALGADVVFITDDNPRSEDPGAIRQAMLDGALAVPPGQRGEIHEVAGRAEAIVAATSAARAGDTVLIAGKGHETGQEVAGVMHPFDDRVELYGAIDAAVAQ
jgi:UDP-N-acetylmuramoyl-L-alanyl-D-glutamate--2,6-diaminopimelate ligase